MPKKISDDFTNTVAWRNDLNKVKRDRFDEMRMMDYIFILEKQNQELLEKVEDLQEQVEKLQKLP